MRPGRRETLSPRNAPGAQKRGVARALLLCGVAAALAGCADDGPGAVPVLPPVSFSLAGTAARIDGGVGSSGAQAPLSSLVAPAALPSLAAYRALADGVPGPALVPLRFADAEQLAKVLAPIVGPGGAIVADAAHRALLVNGDATTRETLVAMIRAFDTDLLAGQSYAVLPARAGEAKELAAGLSEALRTKGEAASRLRVVPLARADAVLVVGTSPAAVEDARRLFRLVQQAERQDTRRWRVSYLQNSSADDAAFVLQQAFTPDNVTAQPRAPAPLTPLDSGNRSQSGGQSGGISGVRTGANTVLAGSSSQSPAASSAGPPVARASPPGRSGGGTARGIRIVPDSANNALLTYATPQEQTVIAQTLRRIDTVPAQVRIDAVIAEVTLNDQLQYGTQFYFKSGGINGILDNATGQVLNPKATTLGTAFPGFVISGRGAGGAPLAISALQGVTRVEVLSSPQLLVVDNHPARLQVGNLVPYLTGASQGTQFANAPVISSIGYQPTGVTLQILPRIGQAGQVQLQISQEVSDVLSSTTSAGGIQSPTFSTRQVDSQIVVQDGDTLGLAGIVRDTVTTGNSGIPWFKDIPLLGFLAGTQTNTRTRTELLVLVTPHVVRAPLDVQAAAAELRDANINAATVAGDLRAAPPSGSPDPSRAVRRRLRLER